MTKDIRISKSISNNYDSSKNCHFGVCAVDEKNSIGKILKVARSNGGTENVHINGNLVRSSVNTSGYITASGTITPS